METEEERCIRELLEECAAEEQQPGTETKKKSQNKNQNKNTANINATHGESHPIPHGGQEKHKPHKSTTPSTAVDEPKSNPSRFVDKKLLDYYLETTTSMTTEAALHCFSFPFSRTALTAIIANKKVRHTTATAFENAVIEIRAKTKELKELLEMAGEVEDEKCLDINSVTALRILTKSGDFLITWIWENFPEQPAKSDHLFTEMAVSWLPSRWEEKGYTEVDMVRYQKYLSRLKLWVKGILTGHQFKTTRHREGLLLRIPEGKVYSGSKGS